MDTYRKTLLLLKDLLHKSDNYHWEQWIDRDILEWDNSKSTSHHKSAFGGIGSINDLAVGGQGKIGAWKNNLFDLLKSVSWTFAVKNKIQFPSATVASLEGAICRDCSYSEISEGAMEHYISMKHLPTNIAALLPTDQYLNLTDFDTLTDTAAVVIDRQRLLTALAESKIHYSTTGNWLKSCPACSSLNTCVYRWEVSGTEDRIILKTSRNNLTINADRAKTTWWKRLKGLS